MATDKPPAVLGLPVVIFMILGVLLAAPAEDPGECITTCADIPPFVATRTELLIYDPPPLLPPGPRD